MNEKPEIVNVFTLKPCKKTRFYKFVVQRIILPRCRVSRKDEAIHCMRGGGSLKD